MTRLLPLLLCLAWTGQAMAQEAAFFSVRNHPHYPEPEKSLKQLVRTHGTKRQNHFCVIGFRMPSGYEHAWVHWEEGKAIILWEGSTGPESPVLIAYLRRFLKFDEDVVATQEEAGSSTYLVTWDWVNSITRDCEAHGDKFVISKPRQQRSSKKL